MSLPAPTSTFMLFTAPKIEEICTTPDLEKRLYPFVVVIGRKHAIPLLSAGELPNHSYLLFLLPANMSLASAMNTFKANSFPSASGYSRLSVAKRIGSVQRESFANRTGHRIQPEHHKKMTFEEEFLSLLRKSGVRYDPTHVFGSSRVRVPHLRRSRCCPDDPGLPAWADV